MGTARQRRINMADETTAFGRYIVINEKIEVENVKLFVFRALVSHCRCIAKLFIFFFFLLVTWMFILFAITSFMSLFLNSNKEEIVRLSNFKIIVMGSYHPKKKKSFADYVN
jgi:hypothetical protein